MKVRVTMAVELETNIVVKKGKKTKARKEQKSHCQFNKEGSGK